MTDKTDIDFFIKMIRAIKLPDFARVFSNNITKPEYIILRYCQTHGDKDIYVSSIVKLLSVSPQALSKQLRCCEQKGYIKRITDTADRRNVKISLTPLGREVAKASACELHRLKKSFEQRIDVLEFHELMQRLYEYNIILSKTINELSWEDAH